MSVEVCDRAATQEICQVAGLKETPQDAKPAVAQSKGRERGYSLRDASSMYSIQRTFLRKSWRSGWWRTCGETITRLIAKLFQWMEPGRRPIAS